MRSEGISLANIASTTGSTVSVVRRIVGPTDKDELLRQQQDAARRIDALPLSWKEKVEMWKQDTGQCGTTFWRVLRRLKVATAEEV